MGTTIYQLNYQYQGDSYFIIDGNKGHRLQSDELDLLQARTIQDPLTKGLIPLEISENGFAVSLQYSISSKRPLSSALQEKSISIEQFYKIIFNLTSIIDEGCKYKLNEEHYVLHPDFIFVGENIQDIHLLYLPLKYITDKKTVSEELKGLLVNMIISVNNMSGNGFQELMSLLNDSSFSIGKVKELASSLTSGNSQIPFNSKSMESIVPSSKNTGQKQNNISEEVQVHKGKDSRLVKIMTTIFCVIGIIFMWIYYFDSPSEKLFYICLTLSVLVICVPLMTLTIFKATLANQKRKKQHNFTDRQPNDLKPLNQPIVEVKVDDLPNSQQKTTSLSQEQPDATVLLNDQLILPTKKRHPILERNKEGVIEKVEIDLDSFTVGRNSETATYSIQSPGISRMHFEIVSGEKGYALKDLGSSNGTKLNEKKLESFKIYTLKDGDIITCAKEELKFRMES
ncbi:FHA domain-containing protein [Cytobacillus sp. IB215316]|uniref:FHA domain-containing protein n=1 Tax=Cytobacillus sp. IB215316 TaxID=3097354 RepID=UPI002A0E9099|nr:FHA domain-containing protein [Cytobacillus sp. IB215316]MDX8360755.1 FHA domain-containing protein [Cytobacillus sp. IB215316]